MKKELLLTFAAFFFMSLTALTGVYAGESKENAITILKNEIDVTGDQKEDIVYLKANGNDENGDFLKRIQLEVHSANGQIYRKNLDSGYSPKAAFMDLNHDGITDIYITIPTGEKGGLANFQLFTLKGNKLTEVHVPESLTISSQFHDGYKAAISIGKTEQSYTFDLTDRKEEYDLLGLYRDGVLNEPTELMVMPFNALTPRMMEGGRAELIGSQQISGVYTTDGIAKIESTWFYENEKWVLANTTVKTLQPSEK